MTQGSNLCLLHWQVDPFTTAPPTPSFKSECQPHWLQISFDPCTLTLFLLIITLYFGVKAFYFPCCQLECYPPGSSAHEILQTRILEWVAISFSGGSSVQGIILPGSNLHLLAHQAGRGLTAPEFSSTSQSQLLRETTKEEMIDKIPLMIKICVFIFRTHFFIL